MKNTKLKKKSKRKENEEQKEVEPPRNMVNLVVLQFVWYTLIFAFYYWIIAKSGGPKIMSAITTG
jgi:hypothetical protein